MPRPPSGTVFRIEPTRSAYARLEPAAALTAAAAPGVLVGLAVAVGSSSGKGWLAPGEVPMQKITKAGGEIGSGSDEGRFTLGRFIVESRGDT